MEEARYLTDDRDYRVEDQRELVIQIGGNGDWYVSVAPKGGRTTRGVRICTSGGASFHCPGLTDAISRAYRAMRAAAEGQQLDEPSYSTLKQEVDAWRRFGSRYVYDDASDTFTKKEGE